MLTDLTVVGAYGNPEAMNAASRVKVRNARCSPTGSAAATCRYEASRCFSTERDADGDGWCARTSKFVRVDGQRAIGDVVVRGWALDR